MSKSPIVVAFFLSSLAAACAPFETTELPPPSSSSSSHVPRDSSGESTVDVAGEHCPERPLTPPSPEWVMPDPTSWSRSDSSASGVMYFRSATQEERAQNNLPEGSFFLATNAFARSSLSPPGKHLQFDLPIAPKRSIKVRLELRSTSTGETYSVTEVESAALKTRVFSPTFFTYWTPRAEPTSPRSPLLRAVLDDFGGVSVSGVDGSHAVSLGGPRRNLYFSKGLAPEALDVSSKIYVGQWTKPAGVSDNNCGNWLLPPTSESDGTCYEPPVPASEYNQCDVNDLLDDDLDGLINAQDDACRHRAELSCDGHYHVHKDEGGREMAMMGTATYCMAHQDDWWSEMHLLADNAKNAFLNLPHDPNPPEAYWGVNTYQLRMRAGHCWIFPAATLTEASNCEGHSLPGTKGYNPATCGAFQGYLYAETSNDPDQFLDRAWQDVERTTAIPGALPYPIEIAAVITKSKIGVAGKVNHPENNPIARERGALVYTNIAGAPVISFAHELLHLIGLGHDDAPGGIMNKGGDGVELKLGKVIEGTALMNASNETLYREGMTTKGYPRPNGFHSSF